MIVQAVKVRRTAHFGVQESNYKAKTSQTQSTAGSRQSRSLADDASDSVPSWNAGPIFNQATNTSIPVFHTMRPRNNSSTPGNPQPDTAQTLPSEHDAPAQRGCVPAVCKWPRQCPVDGLPVNTDFGNVQTESAGIPGVDLHPCTHSHSCSSLLLSPCSASPRHHGASPAMHWVPLPFGSHLLSMT